MSSIRSKRGGHATTAKRFEDTVLNITEAAMLLKCSVSRVRQRSEAGSSARLGWRQAVLQGRRYHGLSQALRVSPEG